MAICPTIAKSAKAQEQKYLHFVLLVDNEVPVPNEITNGIFLWTDIALQLLNNISQLRIRR
jgi:hypothetical protein